LGRFGSLDRTMHRPDDDRVSAFAYLASPEAGELMPKTLEVASPVCGCFRIGTQFHFLPFL